jgi:signal transduction histidine kinase
VLEERTRIARDLHDILAHAMSVITVQAGVGAHLLERDPEQARKALEVIEQTGRGALGEMRRLLRVLRADDLPTEPQPGLASLDRLAAQATAAGVPVELQVEGPARPLPAGLEVSAYRIAQEALTNTIKHAGPARAEVRIVYGPDALTVVVADDGRGAGFEPGPGGHGIAGMRERVTVYDGDLDAGPHPGGGFRVRARLPLEATAAAAEAVRL